MASEENYGYKSEEALLRLHEDIENLLRHYERKIQSEGVIKKLKILFSDRNSLDSPLDTFNVISTLLSIVGLIFCSYYNTALAVFLILIINLLIVVRENILKRTEIFRKVRGILSEIKLASQLCKEWDSSINYPHLCSPVSPCVTLQWCYRDGEIVNLPYALLVRGDHIVMRPGQIAPAACKELNGTRSFTSGETYGLTQPTDPPLKPVARSPLPDLICVLEVSPYIENLQISLDKFLDRPTTIHNEQRSLMISKFIQRYLFTIILVAIVITAILRITGIFIPGKVPISWQNIFVRNSVAALLPILPLMFPVLWISIDLWGIARLETLLSIPQPLMRMEGKKSELDLDLDTPQCDMDEVYLPRKQVFVNWWGLLNGSCDLLGRSANIVQVLGSITALCVVDKKGILSWPNPTPEKVFFLRESTDDTSDKSSEGSINSNSSHNNKEDVIPEVLDLTHDQHSPFKLEFDDTEWKNHLASLKPLGLAILCNTCCPETQLHYSKFCGHITASAILSKHLIPALNRFVILEESLKSFMHGRCLCELARQIGFTPSARNIFTLEAQISSYRHLQPDVVRRDIRFARSLHLASKLKIPFPHSLSVVISENKHGGCLQLLTQGTADIILDMCDDYWSGKDLRPLTTDERKRAQDFYQRNALTAYCTAFSYRPLRRGISGKLAGTTGNVNSASNEVAYLELPPESKYKMMHVERNQCDYPEHALGHSLSTDSLFTDSKNHEEEYVTDADGCFEMQCHQVFIGMVTMQYQTQTDIVQLIERLERACIRFVHFSKENELRSRVFSEKMGLESGWNCHISLLSDDDSNLPSPKSSRHFDVKVHHENEVNLQSDLIVDQQEFSRLLPPTCLESSKTLSSSAPCAISNPDSVALSKLKDHNSSNSSTHSKDSALEANDELLQSLSILTDSTEQSAQLPIYMANRAKLPRGIKNIPTHLENVDNVPLQVSLFTDCSSDATKQMLAIMQEYGEVVVVLGSSASNANSEIFLQGDCSIAMEPLYPQVCQDFPAYTESNIYNNKLNFLKSQSRSDLQNINSRSGTISPIFLSRILNSVACSITVCRDDPISIIGLVELARRFTIGLWNCVQFWACCAVMISALNLTSSCVALPPIIQPHNILYLMCFIVPLLAVSLVRIETDNLMTRATGKKQQKFFNSRIWIFVIWSYAFKFLPVLLIMIFSFLTILSHPLNILESNDDEDFHLDLDLARKYIMFALVLHLLVVSASFVHRDRSIWHKSPFSNRCWVATASVIILLHTFIFTLQLTIDDYISQELGRTWPILLFLVLSTTITFSVVEFLKYQEIKANIRYQRRARLDFGTKLGMNSPF